MDKDAIRENHFRFVAVPGGIDPRGLRRSFFHRRWRHHADLVGCWEVRRHCDRHAATAHPLDGALEDCAEADAVVGRRMAGVLPEVAGNEGEDLALAERDPPDHRLVFPVPLLSLLENAAARMCMSFAGPRWP